MSCAFVRIDRVNAMHVFRLAVLCAVAALALGLSGCSGERPPLEFPSATLEGPYRLDTGDQLRVVVYDQNTLSNTYTVDQSGYISMPLIGAVQARGSTTAGVELRISGQLARSFLRDPNVSVEVASYRPFFVLGEVGNPGQYPYVPGMTAETAIAVAGGFTARSNMRTVRVSRTLDGELHEGRVAVIEPIRPGDTIFVSERLF